MFNKFALVPSDIAFAFGSNSSIIKGLSLNYLRRSRLVSEQCKDFIARLLTFEPRDRLGSKGGLAEIKTHAWLQDVDWLSLERKNQLQQGSCGKAPEPIVPDPFRLNCDACVADMKNINLNPPAVNPSLDWHFDEYWFNTQLASSSSPSSSSSSSSSSSERTTAASASAASPMSASMQLKLEVEKKERRWLRLVDDHEARKRLNNNIAPVPPSLPPLPPQPSSSSSSSSSSLPLGRAGEAPPPLLKHLINNGESSKINDEDAQRAFGRIVYYNNNNNNNSSNNNLDAGSERDGISSGNSFKQQQQQQQQQNQQTSQHQLRHQQHHNKQQQQEREKVPSRKALPLHQHQQHQHQQHQQPQHLHQQQHLTLGFSPLHIEEEQAANMANHLKSSASIITSHNGSFSASAPASAGTAGTRNNTAISRSHRG